MKEITRKKIPINKPSISALEIKYVNDAITNGWGEKCYDYIFKFEKLFTDYQKTKYGLATSSCTGAIHLALMAMGVKAGDEVIIPENTWIATVEPILYIGAVPIFVDILEDTWCINPEEVEKAITPKTKAIIVVHLYGNVCEMDEIMDIAKRNNVKVLEDAAEGLGSEYKGKKCGSIADAGVFSFHGTKTVSTGEGGVLVTNDEQVYENAKVLNDHGRNPKDPENKAYWMRNYGYKYKMSNLQAAMGCAQMERIEDLVEKKRLIFSWYKKGLAGLPLQINIEQSYAKNSYWLPTVVIDEKIIFDRDEFFELCKQNNIDTRPFFYPLSYLPMFEDRLENKVAYSVFSRGVNLPSFHDITEEELNQVIKLFKIFFAYENTSFGC